MQIVKHKSQVSFSDVERYHLLNVTLQKLQDAIGHQRFTDSRMGIVPPENIREAVFEVLDAAQTLRDLL
mgnify:FL=1